MADKKYFPMFLDLNNKRCLVIGAGNIALRKVKTLLEFGAVVKVISKDILDEFYNLDISIEKRAFMESDLKGSFLVVAGTDDQSLNEKIVKECDRLGILVNNITSKIDMSVRFASTICTDEYSIGISANGYPKKSLELKKKIEELMKKEPKSD